jgi:acyl carrier protein phosphodiesterase
MNFLAHLFLAEPSDESRIGSVLADFTAGRIEDLCKKYGQKIARGIQQHREVDKFTDTHTIVLHSISCLQPKHGMFSGIIVDVCYDHFLLKHWSRFSHETLPDFIESVHTSLSRQDWEFPPRYQWVIPRMIKGWWLTSYRSLDGVNRALVGISYRFSRETTLTYAIESIQQCYQELEEDFLRFFPEIIAFVHDGKS